MIHGTIPVPASLAMRLLEEINRHRALHDDETDLLEILVTRGHRSANIRFQWSPKLERELARASHRASGVRDFAAKHQISENAAYKRLCVIRARKGKLRGDGRKG